ncbi:uncharacterized protein [Euwallacea similis]|uniref:uncharacterized protein n=1 Tax=Euwallacea similis TaxID=1736056 RepID=UPI0034505C45
MWALYWTMMVVMLGAQAHFLEPTRVKRGIWGPVTSTVFKTVEQTHYVPASCVHVSPNLPQCRREKLMYYPSFDANAFKLFKIGNQLFPTTTASAEINSTTIIAKRADNNPQTTQGWGEFLGFYRPTITVTELKIHPTTVLDSRIMVTYDIRDCKPRELPSNLPQCTEEKEPMEIVPTSTVSFIKPTIAPLGRTQMKHELYGAELLEEHEPFRGATQGV